MAGGVGGSGKLQAILLGGGSGKFCLAAGVGYAAYLRRAFARLAPASAPGVVMLFDDFRGLKGYFWRVSLNSSVTNRVASVFRAELETVRQEEILHRLAAGTPKWFPSKNEIAPAERGRAGHAATPRFVDWARTAPAAILSAIERWSLFS